MEIMEQTYKGWLKDMINKLDDVGILYYQMVSFFHRGYFLSLLLVGVFDLLFYVYSLITHLNTAFSKNIIYFGFLWLFP